jgi:hypothetical protein
MSEWKHPNDMSREELRDLVGDMSWMALDIAQHLNFMNLQFTPGGRREGDEDDGPGYIAAERMAYALSALPYRGPEAMEGLRRTPGVAVFDGQGGFSV